MCKELKTNGFSFTTMDIEPGRPNIFAQKNPKNNKKSILFYGHLDTVTPANGWKNSLEAKVKGDILQGLGSYDMKGGIVAILEATKNINRYVKIFLASDEEKDSLGAWDALEKNKDFFDDVELVISAEPNFDNGINSITVGRTGRALFEVIANGKAVHIAKQSEGIDSIDALSKYLVNFYSSKSSLTDSALQAYKIEAESIGMSVCAKAGCEIEALIGLKNSKNNILKWLREINKNPNIKINYKKRKTPYLDSYFFEKFPYQKDIARIIKSATGKEMRLISRKSVGDDNVLASLGIPVITWGPDGGNAHARDEWVSLSSLEKLVEMYKSLLNCD